MGLLFFEHFYINIYYKMELQMEIPMNQFESICCLICFLFATFMYTLIGCVFLKIAFEMVIGVIKQSFHFLFFS
jgi:hypothetical protein